MKSSTRGESARIRRILKKVEVDFKDNNAGVSVIWTSQSGADVMHMLSIVLNALGPDSS